jgi:hypothetical protein
MRLSYKFALLMANPVAKFHMRQTIPENKTDDQTLIHTSIKTIKELHVTINTFIGKHRLRMQTLLANAGDVPLLLPSWQLGPSADEGLAKHVSGLCIPTISGGRPSLLLHDLGEQKYALDRERIARIPDIFSFADHTFAT